MDAGALLGSEFASRLATLRTKLLVHNHDAHDLSLEGLVDIASAKGFVEDGDNAAMLGQVQEYANLMANKEDFVDVSDEDNGKNGKGCILGQGQFAEVRLVREKKRPEALYALKTMSKARTSAESARMERTVMASSKSQWIVKLYFAFQDEEKLFLVMQYCPGGDLRALLDRTDGPFEVGMVRFYMAELTLALRAVHELGFVHRDVKPENVLIDCFGHIKLADFGSVEPLSKATKRGGFPRRPVGTPNYVSPEVLQCLEDNSDSLATEKTDFWSLGVLGYEMITGGLNPFMESQKSSLAHTYANIMQHETKRLHATIDKKVVDDLHLRDLLKGLLQHSTKRRLGYDAVVRHDFFLSIDWDAISNSCPPFVPNLRNASDTKYFNTTTNRNKKYSPPRRLSKAKTKTYVGFSYCGQHQLTSNTGESTDLADLVASMRRQNDDLRSKIAQLSKNQRTITRQETSTTSLITKKESEDLKTTVTKLEELLTLEREERADAESKSLQLLASVKKKWEAREEERVAALKQELAKTQKKAEHSERELEMLVGMVEKDKAEIKKLMDVKQQLKVKLKESKDKLEDYRGQLSKTEEQLEHKDESKALVAEIKELKQKVKTLSREKEEMDQNAKNSIKELELKVHALEFEVNHQRAKKDQQGKENERMSKELKALKTQMDTTKQEKLKLEEEVRQQRDVVMEANEKENVKSSNDVIDKGSNHCSPSLCEELREQVKFHKVETRVAERKLKDCEERVKFLREVMIREEKEGRIKAEKELQTTKEELKDMKTRASDLEREKERIDVTCTGAQKELSELRSKLTQLRLKEEECNDLKSQRDDLQRKLTVAEKAASESSELSKRCRTMKATCLELEDQITEYENVVGRLERKLQEAINERDTVKSEYLKYSKDNSELRINVNELKSELALTQSKLKETESKHHDVEEVFKSEEANWVSRLESITKVKKDQKIALEELQYQLKSLTKNYELVNAEYSDLRSAHMALTEESAGLKTNVHSLKESNLKLNSVMEEMLEKLELRNTEIRQLRERLESLKDEKQRREYEFLTQNSQLNKLIDHLRRELKGKPDHVGSILTPNPRRREDERSRMARSPTRTPRN